MSTDYMNQGKFIVGEYSGKLLTGVFHFWKTIPISGVHLIDCECTTDYRSRISCLNLTPLFVLFVFLQCRLTSGAFTIDSSTPTMRINLNEHTKLAQ
jgi:hypothetical protein